MTELDLLGAHVSTAGGVGNAPGRGAKIGATAIQIFTKTPNQWREPALTPAEIAKFTTELGRTRMRAVVAHDSYLINLASPDSRMRAASTASFKAELRRCKQLGVEFLVTHPGNYKNDRAAGLRRNAAAYEECLETIEGPVLLIETTAGAGTALGATFEELAQLLHLVPASLQERIAFCADTCHLYSAGYDLVNDWEGVWHEWDKQIGLRYLRCIHLNDSKFPFGSHRDRHEWIGEGTIGPGPFRMVMQDTRFRNIIKIIETPKGDDATRHDRRMLRRLRAYARRTSPRRQQ
jgi:deoxyribonuclease-4